MALVRLFVVAVALAAGTPARAQSVADWTPYITEASRRFGVPASWIERVMRAESNGRTRLNGRPIRSRAGAIGLMQLMPGTWADMRAKLGLGTNPDDPRDNILAGTYYLRLMYDRFGYPGAFAAYNAGPARYANHLATGRALPGETIAYVQKVEGRQRQVVETARVSAPGNLFAVQRQDSPEPSQSPAQASSSLLFAVRKDGP